MASLPRVVTVDPTSNIAQLVRGAIELIDRLVIQIDVPGGAEVLEELENSSCDVVVSSWEPGDDMRGWELAAKIKQMKPETTVIILADYEDTALDEETLSESPFVYFQRPFDPAKFIRVMVAALDHGDIEAALADPKVNTSSASPALVDMGPVPEMNLSKAERILDNLISELGAIGLVLSTRTGEVLLERGTVGFVDRDELVTGLLPAGLANLAVKDMVGGNATTLQFYDGEQYDIFMLSVGLHHFLTIIFDGQKGSRALGIVKSFGRRSAEDLIALLGAQAWMIMRPVVQEPEPQPARTRPRNKSGRIEPEVMELARAQIDTDEPEEEIEPAAELETLNLEAIPENEFDLDALFGDDGLEESDDIFADLDALGELAQQESRKGLLDGDGARELGLIGD